MKLALFAFTFIFAATTCGKGDGVNECDLDNDGYYAEGACTETYYTSSGGDCDDEDPDINPGMEEEYCNGVDENCDGMDAERGSNFHDMDGDGLGDKNNPTSSSCDIGAGIVKNADDCDDTNPELTTDCSVDEDGDGYGEPEDCNDFDANIHPDAAELCNGLDDDCDGETDEDAADTIDYYMDVDGDGYGDGGAINGCPPEDSSYAVVNGDCDDLEFAIHPGATETCTDTVDKNCDGYVGAVDNDGDGYYACEECDDGNVSNFPGADEYCDGEDNNCDGTVDGDAEVLDPNVYYADADADGYGNASAVSYSCAAPSGYVTDATDCNDAESAVNPGEAEVCNDVDDDCSGAADDGATDMSTWYADADADGYGGTTSTKACDQPSGYVSTSTDCNDGNANANPGKSEVCDSVDNDCDSSVDEGVTTTFYQDADADGYGNATVSTAACSAPSGYTSNATDCDDSDSAVNPGEAEICNSVDDDCDGKTDDDDTLVADQSTWYLDGDSDGYGSDSSTVKACDEPSGYAAEGGDCNDAKSTVNPGRDEACNGVDDDCNGSVDDGAPGGTTYYADSDADGYGDPDVASVSCSSTAPSGYVTDNTDCDDTTDVVNPGATEYNTVRDEDCDGQPFVSTSFTLPSGSTATIVTDSVNLLDDESATFRNSSGGSTGSWTVTDDGGGGVTIADIGPYAATWVSWYGLDGVTHYDAALLETTTGGSMRCIGLAVSTTSSATYAMALTTRNSSSRTNKFCLYVDGTSVGCVSLSSGAGESFKGIGSFTATASSTDLELCSTDLRGGVDVTEIGAFEALITP